LDKFWNNFNYVAVIVGLFSGLLISIILKFFIGSNALFLLPIMAGVISVYLSREADYITGISTGLLAGLISIIWIGPYFLILGPLGGFLGVLLNLYLGDKPESNPVLKTKENSTEGRVRPIQNWIRSLNLANPVIIIVTVLIGVVLVWGVFAVPTLGMETNHGKTIVHSNNTTKNQSSISPADVALKKNITQSVELFFSNFNLLFKQNGVNNGYIISSIKIENLTKISLNQVQVTVTLTRKTSNGGQFNSVWKGPFFLVNGTWVDKGEFIQIHSYNVTSGKDTL
jgi:hypothetical protein